MALPQRRGPKRFDPGRRSRRASRKYVLLRGERLEDRNLLAAFTSGDIAVYRVGNNMVAGDGGSGTATLGSGAADVFVDEYTPAGALVQTIALPTADSGSTHALVASGSATSEGELNLSADGQYLTFVGYDAAPGTASIASSTVPRTVAEIGVSGAVDTSTALTDFALGDNARAAASTDGTQIWLAGGDGTAGLQYIDGLGGTASTPITNASGALTSVRDVEIFGGQLYLSQNETKSGTNSNIETVGSGEPIGGPIAPTGLNGVATSLSETPDAFFFANLGSGQSFNGYDTLYVADAAKGITKYSYNGTAWSAVGTVGSSGKFTGLTGTVSAGHVTLYATGPGGLYTLTDTGSDWTSSSNVPAMPAPLVAAPANELFHGVAWAPTSVATLGNSTPALAYAAGSPAAIVSSTLSVSLAASDTLATPFNGGTLTATLASGESIDQLSINNQGTGTGQVGVSGSNVTYSGSTIGTFTGGTIAAPLVISFNSSGVTAAVVQAVARQVSFSTSTAAATAHAPTVTFQAAIDGASGANSVTVAVDVDNRPMIAVNAGVSVAPGATVAIGNNLLKVADSDNSDAQLTFTIATTSAHGALEDHGAALAAGSTFTQADIDSGQITYMNASGTSDDFTFTVSDGVGGSIGLTAFSIAIRASDAPPVLAVNAGLSVAPGATATIGSSQLGVTDADNTDAQLTFMIATPPTLGTLSDDDTPLAAGSTFTQADIDNGLLSYTNNGGVNPADGFTFTVVDGAGGTIGSTNFSITINHVDQPPVNTVPGAQSTPANSALVFSTSNGNAISIADPDAGESPVQVTLSVSHGMLTLGATAGLTISSGGNGQASLTANGTIAKLNAALTALSYVPSSGFTGLDTLQLSTDDLGHTGIGGPKTIANSVPITVAAVPDVLINEIEANPPGTQDNRYEYIELRGTPGTSLKNVDLVVFDGISTDNVGTALLVVDLSAYSLGSDGLLVIKSPAGGQTIPAATTVVTNAYFTQSGGLPKGTLSFYLFDTPAPFVTGTDYDTNNDGVLDHLPAGATVLDDLALLDNHTPIDDTTYGPAIVQEFNNQGTPDAATRFDSASVASSSLAWYGGELVDTGNVDSQLNYDVTRESANEPTNAVLTPGAPNSPNAVPTLAANIGLSTFEGATADIDNSLLDVASSDSSDAQLLYTLSMVPAHGTLAVDGTPLAIGGTFTQTSVDAGDLSYTQNGSANVSDSFTFSVSDAAGNTLGPATFAISVDRPPAFANLSYSFVVQSTAANGTAVATVAATDPDPGDSVSYSLTAGNSSGAFTINSSTGAVTLVNAAALSAADGFTLVETATDNHGAVGTTTLVLAINHPPAFVQSSYTFVVPQGAANGMVVGTTTATDPDSGDTVGYSIAVGNSSGAFGINSTTGAISVTNAAQLGTSIFSLTVAATDSHGATATADVTINLVQNHAPLVSPQTFGVNSKSAAGAAIGTVIASGPDAGQTLTYAILSGNSNGALAINAATGHLTVADPTKLPAIPAGKTSANVTLDVQVTDNGSPALSTSAVMTLAVSATAAMPPVYSTGTASFSIAATSARNTTFGSAAAQPSYGGQSIRYSLAGADAAAFAISTAGVLTARNPLDYQSQQIYQLSVVATDARTGSVNPQFSTLTVTIHVADVPPQITGTRVSQAVRDNSTIAPFSTVKIAAAASTDLETVTIALDNAAKGAFTASSVQAANGLTTTTWNATTGTATITGTAATVTPAIAKLVFAPTPNRVAVGLSETTHFTITAGDGTAAATDTTASVVSTSVDDLPAINATLAAATSSNPPNANNTTDKQTTLPFASVTVTDPDVINTSPTSSGTGQTLLTTVTLSSASNGVFTAASLAASGFAATTTRGSYTFSGTATQATAAIRELVFQPTANQVLPNSTVTTILSIRVSDGFGAVVNNARTTVSAVSVNDPPSIAGVTTASQSVNDNATLQPFASATLADPDIAAKLSVVVTLDVPASGTLAGGVHAVAGVAGEYVYTGSPAAASAALQALVFKPMANLVAPGVAETVHFTISVSDSLVNSPVTNSETTVVIKSINDAPTIGGTSTAAERVNDNATIAPFARATIADPDVGQTLTLTVTLDNASQGTLAGGGFATGSAPGSYTATAASNSTQTAAQVVQAALRQLIFTPTRSLVTARQTFATVFTISVSDSGTLGMPGSNLAAADSKTTVITTAA